MSPRPRFSRRRKLWLGALAVLLAAVAWLHFTGAAATHGTELREMDWDGDGTASQHEWLQSIYAVVVTTASNGPRECRTYAWRDGGTIRVDCRTVLNQDAAAKQ